MKITHLKFKKGLKVFLKLWWFSIVSTFILLGLGRCTLWLFASGTDFLSVETLKVWIVAWRFDAMVAAYFALPALLCWVASFFVFSRRKILLRFSAWSNVIAGTLLIILSIINFGFFCEYQDQFNIWVLGLVNDDAVAIAGTFWRDYHWGRYLLALVGGSALWIFISGRVQKALILRGARERQLGFFKMLAWIVFSIVVGVICFRGGVGHRPVRMRDAAICDDQQLNRLVLNPAYAFKHVVIDSWKISNEGTPPEFVRDVREQAVSLYGNAAKSKNILELITTKNERFTGTFTRPKQIFLFVLESYDRWPMLEKYQDLELCAELKKLETAGASSDNFISDDSGTMRSLSTIFSGIPNIEVAQNYRPRGNVALATATANIFKRLGYKTRFAYCGYGFWQHVEKYALAQGFDEFVFGSDVPDCPAEYKGEWGVPDHYLYDYLEKLAEQDGETPVFTVILSASYHPPYNLPLEKFGVAPLNVPVKYKDLRENAVLQNTLAHFKYSDFALGKFVRERLAREPNAIFAITGDHFSRRFLNKKPTLSERSQVPFVIVGNGIPAGTLLPFGTHADIVPTLLALCAPEGFEYQSFGVNLLSSQARERECSFGAGVVLHARGGFSYVNSKTFYGERLSENETLRLKAIQDARRALAWYYFEKGEKLNIVPAEK